MEKRDAFAVISLLAALLAGCATGQSTPTETFMESAETEPAPASTPLEAAKVTPTAFDYGEEGVLPAEANELIEAVRADLALRLDIEVENIEVAYVEAMNWPDAALECPLPGADYAQVITPGYLIELRVEGDLYEYHTDAEHFFVLCRDGEPEMPLIPIKPGEIDDGQPWMPAGTPEN